MSHINDLATIVSDIEMTEALLAIDDDDDAWDGVDGFGTTSAELADHIECLPADEIDARTARYIDVLRTIYNIGG